MLQYKQYNCIDSPVIKHWYTLFGFFYSQQSDEQKLEIIQPWNKDSLLVEIFNVLKTGRVDTLKVNMLVFIEENITFFFGSHPTTYVLKLYDTKPFIKIDLQITRRVYFNE